MSLKIVPKSRRQLKTIEDKVLYYLSGLCEDLTAKEIETATAVKIACNLMEAPLFFKMDAVKKLSAETGKSERHCFRYFSIAEYVVGKRGNVDKKAMRTLMWKERLRQIESLNSRMKKLQESLDKDSDLTYIPKALAVYSALIEKHYAAIEKLFGLHNNQAKEKIIDPAIFELPELYFTTDVRALDINTDNFDDAEMTANE